MSHRLNSLLWPRFKSTTNDRYYIFYIRRIKSSITKLCIIFHFCNNWKYEVNDYCRRCFMKGTFLHIRHLDICILITSHNRGERLFKMKIRWDSHWMVSDFPLRWIKILLANVELWRTWYILSTIEYRCKI